MDLLNQIPCHVLATDSAGHVLAINNELLSLIGGSIDEWRSKTLNDFFPPASRIFLQTHVWPMLLTQGWVKEIQLQILDASKQRIPVLVNSKKGVFEDSESYYWVFFVTQERSRFEGELLKARNLAQASSQALAQSERFIKTVTDGLPGMMAYWDKDLICRFANRPYKNLFSKATHDVLGASMHDLLSQTMLTENQPHIDRVLQGRPAEFEFKLAQPGGGLAYYLATYIPDLDTNAVVGGFFVLIRDITKVKKSEVELKLAASVFDSINVGIMVIDADETTLSVNPAFTDITGYAPDEVLGHVPRILDPVHNEPAAFESMRASIETTGHWEGEIQDCHKQGKPFMAWHRISLIRGPSGEVMRYVSVFSDITARWESTERIKHLALHDQLTGLPNRPLLLERLGQSIARAQREKRNLALLFLDLDGFKAINDQWGHAAGDDVLKYVASTLMDMLRSTDTVARLGGDEFVLLIENPANQSEVARLADQLIKAITLPPNLVHTQGTIGASVGIAMLGANAASADQLMKNADSAMYVAKASGKNQFIFFAP